VAVAVSRGFGLARPGWRANLDIVYTIILEPTGDVPEGLRWNMTASAQIEVTP